MLRVIAELIKEVEQEFVRSTELGGVVCIASLPSTYALMSLGKSVVCIASLPPNAEI